MEIDNLKAESNFEADNIGNGICNINSDTTLQDPARFDEEHEGFLNDINDKRIHSPEQVSKSKFVLYTLLFSRISFVLLAGIVNILLVLKLDNLFGQVCIYIYIYKILDWNTDVNNLHVLLILTDNYYTLLVVDDKTPIQLYDITRSTEGQFINCCFNIMQRQTQINLYIQNITHITYHNI